MEKRQAPRLDHPVLVAYRSVDRFLADFGTNISKSGIFLNSREPLPIGTEVRLLIALPDQPEPYEIRGRVVRLQSAEQGDPGMGLEFLDLSDAVRGRLEALVKHLREGLDQHSDE